MEITINAGAERMAYSGDCVECLDRIVRIPFAHQSVLRVDEAIAVVQTGSGVRIIEKPDAIAGRDYPERCFVCGWKFPNDHNSCFMCNTTRTVSIEMKMSVETREVATVTG